MKDELDALADQLLIVSDRVSELIFQALRAQNSNDETASAKELERDLSRVRRSLVKAEHILRGLTPLG